MPLVPFALNATGGDLTNLGTVFTQLTTWMGAIVDTITGHPIYLVGRGIFVTGSVIGLGYRLIRG